MGSLFLFGGITDYWPETTDFPPFTTEAMKLSPLYKNYYLLSVSFRDHFP